MYRSWLRDEMRAEGFSDLYITMVGMATRATRQKEAIIGERAPERIKRAEHKGAIGAYAYTASRYLRDSHGLEEAEAARVWKDHIKQWRKATDEDEERDKAL